ncbi:NADH-quinone oxidoreductase subunit C [Geobacillus sp. Manikaran-105]|uniref:NADH-quinone oxidoreductase subunit C n=1 Tax=Geobacillus sp. Manikaran-105 TaxID=2055940 RepID=UPI000C28C786|nr:NADH-quinone oxidoreductase subunit C [Geobacillus sp. Manikaran-105]PJW15594.1 NADH-quinone oxidoreductase subunit C [Geobacillus sp. Manikaran-105]
MDEEKDLAQRKREAAERAKQLAREKLAARQATEQAKSSDSVPDDGVKAPSDLSTQPANKETDAAQPASAEDLAAAKKRAAEEARARAAELRRQREAASGAGAGDDLEAAKKKAAEEARAKAAELRRQREAAESGAEDDLELAKKKAAAAAKARAAALAKQKAAEASGDDDELAKQKAAAAAKAKAAAAAKARAAALAKQQGGAGDEGAKQKAAAAARAKAAAAGEDGGAAKPSASSPNDPLLQKYVRIIEEHLGPDVLEDAYINRLAKDVPTLVVPKEAYYKVAEFLKYNEQLRFDYLSELHGTDFQTHMEVYVHLYSYPNRQPVALKVKIERDNPEVDSLVPLWPGANWPECEAYDLLGIRFRGHPNLIRIFLGEQWVGHPLRKDYEPYDAEV